MSLTSMGHAHTSRISIPSIPTSTQPALLPPPACCSVTRSARGRVFSLGFNALELNAVICGAAGCRTNGTGYLSLTVRCQESDVRLSVLASTTPLGLKDDVPAHGEVCPELWIYHRINNASRVRVTVDVHQGTVYYLMSKWSAPPSFAGCNHNELQMTNLASGYVDLCNDPTGTGTAFVGLFGGRSCALYTITASRLTDDAVCSTALTGLCSTSHSSAAAGAAHARRVTWWVALPCALFVLCTSGSLASLRVI